LYFRKKVEFEKPASLPAELLKGDPAFEKASSDAKAGRILKEDLEFITFLTS
jgi:hypothetical protein